MKKLLTALIVLALVLLCSGALADISIDGTFTDPALIEYVTRNFDDDKNGELNREELLKVEEERFLFLGGSGLKNIRGLELFESVEQLQLYDNDLTEIDLSRFKHVVILEIDGNSKLTKLVIGNKPSLKMLTCAGCQLSSLDVSGAPELRKLDCSYNKLTSLNVSSNTKLAAMNCTDNKLTSLTLGTNSNLNLLWCYGNNITALDVSKCPQIDLYPTTRLMIKDADGMMWWGWDGEGTGRGFRMDSKVVLTTSKGLYNVKVDKITLKKDKATLTRTAKEQNPTIALKASVSPENARKKGLKWESSAPEIASVDENGTVTALKAGKATITCTAKDGSGVQASCRITVEDTTVTELRLSKSDVIVTRTSKKPNPTLKLKASKVLPKEAVTKKVTWKSSNPKVVHVDPETGVVTGLKAGKATITCKAADGSKVKAVCRITVEDKRVTAITLNKKTATLKAGKTLQLKIKKITPKDAVNQKVKWKSSNKKVATVDKNGKVTAVKAGTCKITCTAADGSKVYVVCEITVK
jgi:uncharacterized protein YjdB